MLDLIYPENDLDNLVNIISPERLKELRNQWKFKSLPCYCLKLFFDEVIKFHHNHWTSFRKACFMAAEERQGPIRETNIAVDWDK